MCFLLFGLLGVNLVNAQYLKKGDIAPDFQIKTSDGTEFHLADVVKEKYVLLDFTASACGPCWLVYPQLEKLQEQYKDQLQIVAIYSIRDSEALWEQIRGKMDSTKSFRKNWLSAWVYDGDFRKSYPVKGIPTFFLINKEREIVATWFGVKEKRLVRNNWILLALSAPYEIAPYRKCDIGLFLL